MPKNFWENDAIDAPQAVPARQPGVVELSGPDSMRALDHEVKVRGIQNDDRDYDYRVNKDARDQVEKQDEQIFQRQNTLRSQYESNPVVKSYRVAAKELAKGLSTSPDATGDNALIYAYAKVMDPESVVRESEMEMAASGSSWLQSNVANLKKQFGIEGGGQLSPAVRDRMRREMISDVTKRVELYDAQFSRFSEYARRNGIDAFDVVGEHDGKPFLPLLRQFNRDGTRKAAPDANFTTPDDYVTGAEQWGQPDQLQGSRLSKEDEAALQSYVLSRGGQLTPEELQAWFSAKGWSLDAANAKDVAEYVNKTGKYPGLSYANADEAARARAEAELKRRQEAGLVAPDDQLGGSINAQQGYLYNLSDELSGVGHGLKSVLDGGNFRDGYTLGRDTERLMLEKGRKNYGIAPEIIGSILAPGGAGSSAVRGGNVVKAGAIQGGVSGFGAGEGDFDDQVISTASGTALGAGAGYGLDKIGKYVAPRVSGMLSRSENSAGRELAEAARRQDVDIYNADIGGPTTRRLFARSEQTPGGVSTIKSAAERTLESAEAARDRIASQFGSSKRGEGLGHVLKDGAEKAVKNLHNRAQSTYGTVERLTEGAHVQPTKAYQVLSDHLDDLQASGAGQTGLGILQRIQSKMTEGPISVKSARAMRTALRDDFANTNLRGSDIERRANEVMDALTDDIDGSLRANGLDDAADALIKANGEWRAYVDLTDEVVAPIIGKKGEKSGEQVAKALMADLQGNNARAVKFLRALPASEQSTLRASVIAGLGRANKGAQNANGDAFSLDTFLTHWNDIGESAKAAYFGPEARKALNDLAVVANGSKQARRYANSSQTAGGSQSLLRMITTGLPEYALARALTSEKFTRWLIAGAKKPNGPAMRDHVARLTGLAARNPLISGDISALQKWMQEAANDVVRQSPSRASAQGQDEHNAR